MVTRNAGVVIVALTVASCTALVGLDKDYSLDANTGGGGEGEGSQATTTASGNSPVECEATQTDGDCVIIVCDKDGESLTENDDTDLPDDGNECTVDACSEGNPAYTPVESGTECTQDGGKKCNAKGACVECLGNAECTAPETCKNEKCVPSTCSNAAKDGTETDVDCGGADCLPCGKNKACAVNSDCVSNVCTEQVCQ